MPFLFFKNSLIKNIKKETYNGTTIKTTWYIAGHIYERVGTNGEILHTEITISSLSRNLGAAGRLGVAYTNTANNSLDYNYELSDHLGNPEFSPRFRDRRDKSSEQSYVKQSRVLGSSTNPIDILSYADYFPFGWQMPGRNQQGDYRYAYQGQEKDPETGWEAFELGMYDGRVGRWMTMDPYGEFHSPYLAMGNSPIGTIDPDGGHTSDWVEIGGHMVFDSRVKDQGAATTLYGEGAEFHANGSVVNGVSLLEFGMYIDNGVMDFSPNMALFYDINPKEGFASVRSGDGWTYMSLNDAFNIAYNGVGVMSTYISDYAPQDARDLYYKYAVSRANSEEGAAIMWGTVAIPTSIILGGEMAAIEITGLRTAIYRVTKNPPTKRGFSYSQGRFRIENGFESISKSMQRQAGVKLNGTIYKPYHIVKNGNQIPVNPLNPLWKLYKNGGWILKF